MVEIGRILLVEDDMHDVELTLAALTRRFGAHRIWAIRTYLVANGQWFFRLGIFGWILINRGPVGIGKHFDGPFVVFWTVGCYLLPLAIFELTVRTAKWDSSGWRSAMVAVLVVLTVMLIANARASGDGHFYGTCSGILDSDPPRYLGGPLCAAGKSSVVTASLTFLFSASVLLALDKRRRHLRSRVFSPSLPNAG